MKKITFLLVAFIAFCWQANAQTPTPDATLTIVSCPDTQATGFAYDGSVQSVYWIEVAYDGLCDSFTIDTETSDFDTEIGIYDATGALIGNDDDGGTGTLSLFSTNGLAAGIYYIAAGGFNITFGATAFDATSSSTATGTLNVNVNVLPPPPPANDDCVVAIPLSCFGSDSGNSDLGTDTDANGDIDVWYSFDSTTTTAGDALTFSLCGSGFDTIMTVYDSCGGTVLGTNDDFCGLQSEVSIVSDGVTNYLIAVEGFNGATGDYTIVANCPLPTPPTTVGTLDIAGCIDLDTYSAAFDASVSNIVWLELTYDGGCIEATIDTEGSDFDTEIGLYADTGVLIGNDDDGGTGTLSSFTELGLPAGTYYVAAGAFNTMFTDDFGVTSTNTTALGNIMVNASTPAPPAPTTIATLNLAGCGATDSYTAPYDGAVDGVVWLEVIYDGGCTEASFDTETSDFDTELGLYDSNGFLVANDDDGGTGALSLITEVGLPAGTYYLAVGGFNTFYNDAFDATTTNTQSGTLLVTASTPAIPCTPATFTVADGGNNCPDNEFYINVDVTDLGSATTVDITNDGGAVAINGVDGTASPYSVGPFPSGTLVTITVADSAILSCFATDTYTTGVCPAPANDEVVGAIPLSVGDTLCETPVLATNLSATDSIENVNTASCSSSDPAGDVWFSVTVPSSGEVTIEISSSGLGDAITDTVMIVYSGTSGALVEVECDDDDGAGLLSKVELTGLTPGEELLVRVWEWQNNAFGTFEICAWSPSTLGIEEVNNFEGFTYYPNPVKNTLTLKGQKDIQNVAVYNMLGQEVLRTSPNSVNGDVDTSNLNAGTYFVKVTVENATKTIKIIKK